VRVTITQQGQLRRIALIEFRIGFMEALRLQARAEGTTPARLIEEAIQSIVPEAAREDSVGRSARNIRYSREQL
jgi:hypothetical protein